MARRSSSAAGAFLQRLGKSLSADLLGEGLSDTDVSSRIRSEGGDPDGIGRRGAQFMQSLLDERRLAWRAQAHLRIGAVRRIDGNRPRARPTGRPQLLEAIEAARRDPRASGTIAAAFRKKTPEESSEEELGHLYDEVEELLQLDEFLRGTPEGGER